MDNYLDPFGEMIGIDQTSYMTAFGMMDTTSDLAKERTRFGSDFNSAVAALVTAESDEAFEAAWNQAVEDIQAAGVSKLKRFMKRNMRKRWQL